MSDFMSGYKLNTAPPAQIGQGRDGSLASAGGAGPRVQLEGGDVNGKELVKRRHVDWAEHQIRWRFLLDSYEGGERYRNAVYGQDRRGLPVRPLFRHRREYPDPQQYPNDTSAFAGGLGALNPGTPLIGGASGPFPGQLGADPAATAQDDDYELRRARTPVPEFVAEAVEIHLSKVYDKEVEREGPDDITEWWQDVDGAGCPLDDYMRETIAPLLLVLGCLDIVVDHPRVPPGAQVNTRADELRLGLDRAVVSYILPQNMLWWRCSPGGRYEACLVREYVDPSERVDLDEKGNVIDPADSGKTGQNWRRQYLRYRFWTPTESIVFSDEGDVVSEAIPHNFGCVPICRLIDQKKHRTPTIGKSRYEAIAELQREYYNRDSELILSDTLQSHPLLSGPEDYCKADNTLSIGPGYVLPKKKSSDSGTYEGWEYTSPPKDPADSLRRNKQDLLDLKDRRACLTKPAGTAAGSGGGSGSTTVGQSGISKQLDGDTGHKILSSIARTLQRAERVISEFAMLVLRGQTPTRDEVNELKIVYSSQFSLFSAEEMLDGASKFQRLAASSGAVPSVDKATLKSASRQLLPGMADEDYDEIDGHIDDHVDAQAATKQQQREMGDRSYAFDGAGTAESAAGTDPTGQSGSTAVGNYIPAMAQ
jgi:hypothetical protein